MGHQFRAYLAGNPSDRFCREDYEFKIYGGELVDPIMCKFATPKKCDENMILEAFCPKACGLPCPTSCVDFTGLFLLKERRNFPVQIWVICLFQGRGKRCARNT